ncbi:MAG: MBL fold metallo-hydrolase [Verrucomicrobia bacterium CG_4_10_14_3_um_filter_43_23]|nr:MAG: MBL fold metallo-hydrolase [Verrucomicrobia bacterium CG1_02_43_26]PIP58975.1 MAG: MBL fold metallo-hydrolase [Verrucomicrobia bacterium CG22_combo_CG10-13_8_21_14_all_43_17]PIX59073.1 MAG: MBL fold metallo-hydrolase [Verrucomicrobia bacterium CG_4_10_14_3_um_filter_43_23]PIY61405.1 MAG: MBL fold metallo-hydrolase [Verrucomicrobia bacterium CG_4_10_14_0_8_um_filter_43_34]PJA44696.1 MAG: MBL fold metallo-hydrolase [Verrucomicrobia bacterium CG_4_9_14_3_um_filter_43_20]
MKVIFLGTGTSEGVPVIAHDQPGLDLKNPKNWRTRSCVHVEMGGCHIQIDAGQEFRLQCLWHGVRTVDYFILTHGHADHVLGMDDLRRFCQESAIPVYSTEEGLGRVRAVFSYAILDKPLVRGYPAFQLHKMPKRLEVPGGVIYATILPHPPITVLGLVFEEAGTGKRFAYYSDCKTVTEEGQELARGADLVVLDGLRPLEHPSHMTIDEAVAMANIIGGKQTYLTHMTCHIDYDTWQQKMPEGVELAYDGLEVRI